MSLAKCLFLVLNQNFQRFKTLLLDKVYYTHNDLPLTVYNIQYFTGFITLYIDKHISYATYHQNVIINQNSY